MANARTPAADPKARETAPFVVPGVFDTDAEGTRTPREALLYEPTEVQLKTMGRVGEAAAKNGGSWRTVSLTDQMLASLFVSQEDWDDFEVANITAAVTDEEYVEFVERVVRHWLPEPTEAAPRTGPQSTKRPARRAR